MSLEIMKGIQQAEAQADEIRQTAQREARDVVKAVEAAIAQQERAAAIEIAHSMRRRWRTKSRRLSIS